MMGVACFNFSLASVVLQDSSTAGSSGSGSLGELPALSTPESRGGRERREEGGGSGSSLTGELAQKEQLVSSDSVFSEFHPSLPPSLFQSYKEFQTRSQSQGVCRLRDDITFHFTSSSLLHNTSHFICKGVPVSGSHINHFSCSTEPSVGPGLPLGLSPHLHPHSHSRAHTSKQFTFSHAKTSSSHSDKRVLPLCCLPRCHDPKCRR